VSIQRTVLTATTENKILAAGGWSECHFLPISATQSCTAYSSRLVTISYARTNHWYRRLASLWVRITSLAVTVVDIYGHDASPTLILNDPEHALRGIHGPLTTQTEFSPKLLFYVSYLITVLSPYYSPPYAIREYQTISFSLRTEDADEEQ